MTSAKKDVDAYVEAAPAAARPMLRELRRIIFDAVPEVTEKVAYGMPSCEHRGQRLVHFSAANAHLGVYGPVHVDGDVPADLAAYLDHRSTLRFRLDHPLPAAALAAALRYKAGTR
jgi:uncharacterized protein YdhG (YjbR/CyaY superfamily)